MPHKTIKKMALIAGAASIVVTLSACESGGGASIPLNILFNPEPGNYDTESLVNVHIANWLPGESVLYTVNGCAPDSVADEVSTFTYSAATGIPITEDTVVQTKAIRGVSLAGVYKVGPGVIAQYTTEPILQDYLVYAASVEAAFQGQVAPHTINDGLNDGTVSWESETLDTSFSSTIIDTYTYSGYTASGLTVTGKVIKSSTEFFGYTAGSSTTVDLADSEDYNGATLLLSYDGGITTAAEVDEYLSYFDGEVESGYYMVDDLVDTIDNPIQYFSVPPYWVEKPNCPE